MMKSSALAALCCAVGFLIPPAARSTEVQMMSSRDMGTAAAAVVRGRVQDSRCFWNGDHTKIYTEVDVLADETYKGNVSGLVHVLQLGGTVDNIRVTVHGALDWSVGEEVLLFLEAYREDRFVVTGLSQGKFLVERDPSTGEPFVTRVSAGGGDRSDGDGPTKVREAEERQPLGQFLATALDGSGRQREE